MRRLLDICCVLVIVSLVRVASGGSQEQKSTSAGDTGIATTKVREDFKELLHEVGECTTKLKKAIDEWGAASITSPLLTSPKESSINFKFGLNRSASEFFGAAKTEDQAASAVFNQMAFSTQAGVKVSVDQLAAMQFAADMNQYGRDVARQNLIESERIASAKRVYAAELAAANAGTDTTKKAEMISATEQNYMKSISEGAKPPQFPKQDDSFLSKDISVAKPPDIAGRILTNDGEFTSQLGLLKNMDNSKKMSVTDRSAIITAAGDCATQALFELLGNPADAGKYTGTEVYFGVCMVSVEPGWRTRKNYQADVSMQIYQEIGVPTSISIKDGDKGKDKKERLKELLEGIIDAETNTIDIKKKGEIKAKLKEEKISIQVFSDAISFKGDEDPSSGSYYNYMEKLKQAKFISSYPRKNPLVITAVSPMTDNQTIDSAYSDRKYIEAAIRMAGALQQVGAQAQAEVFTQFVKSLQKDVRSINSDAIITSYGFINGFLGYQIGPRLKAMEDPGGNEDAPSNVLGRIAFPVLIVIGVVIPDVDILDPYTGEVLATVKWSTSNLEFRQSFTWMPIKSNWAKRIIGIPKALRENDWTDWMEDIAKVRQKMDEFETTLNKGDKHKLTDVCDSFALLESRIDFLKSKSCGGVVQYTLKHLQESAPPPAVTQIDAIYPSNILIDQKKDEPTDVTVAISGKNLDIVGTDTANIEILNSGQNGAVTVSNVVPSKTLLILKLKVLSLKAPTTVAFKLPLKAEDAKKRNMPPTLLSPIVTFGMPSVVDSERTISRVNKPQDGGTSTTLTIKGNIPTEVILSEINREKTDKTNQDVDVNVSIQGEMKKP